MNLLTIEDLVAAIGRELTIDEETQVEYYITLVSNYIASYTGVSFETKSSVYKAKADYYGIVELPGGPVQEIEDVRYFYGGQAPHWRWDGTDQVYNLQPEVTVHITYTHGYDEIPEDIKSVATEGVKRLFNSPAGQENGPLIRYKVGDVEEMYKAPFNIGLGAGLFNDLETYILDRYKVTLSTMRLGFTQRDVPPALPSSDTALYE